MSNIELMKKRISTRKFKEEKISESDIESIMQYAANVKPLFSDIKWSIQITDKTEVIKGMISAVGKMYYKVFSPNYILLSSEISEKSNENIGYVGQQIVLKLTELGIGSCWIGAPIKKSSFEKNFDINSNERYVIMIAIGYPLEKFSEVQKRPRISSEEIFVGDNINGKEKVLDALRIAPSAVNSQPWIVYGDNDKWDIYIKYKSGLFGSMLKRMNKIDIGIGFSHLILALDEMKIDYKISYKKSPLKIKSQEYFTSITFK